MYTIPTQVRLTQALLETSALIRVSLTNSVSDLGLTEVQWRVISYINGGQGLTQTELALLLGMEKAPLGEQLNALEAKALLQRRADTGDKRVKRIFITPAGKRLAKTLAQRFSVLRSSYSTGAFAGRMESMQSGLLVLSNLVMEDDTRAALAQLTMPNNLHLVGISARLLRKRIRTELTNHRLTASKWRVLVKLLESPQVLQKDLCQELSIAKAPLGKILVRLESAGWLTRSVSEEDRRAQVLRITAQGKRRMRAFYQDLALRLIPLDEFTQAETQQLMDDLQALQQLLLETQESPS